jgi:Fe-S-cluster containining protein
MNACGTCMGCCFGPQEYVQLFEDDLLALGPERVDALVVTSERPGGAQVHFMRMSNGHCAALDVASPHPCTIYEDRPLLCRVFQIDSSSCREKRGQAAFQSPPANEK